MQQISFLAKCALVLLWSLAFNGHAIAQTAPRQHVMLPPALGGTPLSYQIQSEAAYVAAYGDMMESAATARKINAEAVALEIQNSVAYVDAWFKRRELNRQWRAKEDPNYLEREKHIQEVMKRRIEEQFQDVQRGDVTKTLNWMLRELASPVMAYQYLPAEQSLNESQIDRILTERDLKQIRLTDGGSSASRLVFSATDGSLEMLHWPFVLRSPEFADARSNYSTALDRVLAEIKAKKQASYESQKQLINSANSLFVSLEQAYPAERRHESKEFLDYAQAKRFLQAMLAATHRATRTNDASVLSGGVRFQGNTVIQLLQHMYKNGFEFAPPEPGGEGAYKTLFQNMRMLYMTVGPNRPAVDLQPMAPQKRTDNRGTAN